MARPEKVKAVDELAVLLGKSNLVIVTDYRGMTVPDLASLRAKLRQQGVEYKVAKNTLTGFAADKAGKAALREALVGPTALAFGTGDEAALAKVVSDFEKTSKVFKVKAGLLGDRLLSAPDVAQLASLPARPVLLSQVVAGMQAPISGFVGVLGGVLGGLVGTLEARRQQLEGQQA